jgi:hypothetical protein
MFYQFGDLLREHQTLGFPSCCNFSTLIEPLNTFVPYIHGSNAHATRSKISTPNFVESVVSMMYFVPYVKFCMAANRDRSISYDLSQLPNMSADEDQVMAGLQVNNHDQGSKFWISSQFEEPDPSHIYN